MWSARSERLADGQALKVAVDLQRSAVPFAEVLRLWQHDAAFRSFFIKLLADAPFSAFRWETPPITTVSARRPFEFVVLDSPWLDQEPDPTAFADQLGAGPSADGVVSFPNLGGDAILVVPHPGDGAARYGHLAAFLREAPEPQKDALWALVGQVAERELGRAPVWLSTAGAGVPWLHVRLDRRPKYYAHGPYRNPA
jgi:hypothetical protein